MIPTSRDDGSAQALGPPQPRPKSSSQFDLIVMALIMPLAHLKLV